MYHKHVRLFVIIATLFYCCQKQYNNRAIKQETHVNLYHKATNILREHNLLFSISYLNKYLLSKQKQTN